MATDEVRSPIVNKETESFRGSRNNSLKLENQPMEEDESDWTMYHEAGHCVMAVVCGARVAKATISPEEDGFYGIVEIHWPRGRSAADQWAVALAGPVSEMIYRGEPYHPGLVPEWAHDWKQAWLLCRSQTQNDLHCMKILESTVAKLYRTFSSDPWWAAIAAVRDLLDAHEEIDHDSIEYEVRNWIQG